MSNEEKIIEELKLVRRNTDGVDSDYLSEVTKIDKKVVSVTLSKLSKLDGIERVSRGHYRYVGEDTLPETKAVEVVEEKKGKSSNLLDSLLEESNLHDKIIETVEKIITLENELSDLKEKIEKVREERENESSVSK